MKRIALAISTLALFLFTFVAVPVYGIDKTAAQKCAMQACACCPDGCTCCQGGECTCKDAACKCCVDKKCDMKKCEKACDKGCDKAEKTDRTKKDRK